MSIHSSGKYDSVHRLKPIYGDKDESDNRNDSRQKKIYQGRSWSTEEEDLPLLPIDYSHQKMDLHKDKPLIYADLELYKIAKKKFESLTTIEEKVAQICFYQTEASYDQITFKLAKELIIGFQIGGLLFNQGDYRRQSYLIEHYQSLSKIPLLIGNDYSHGLSFFMSDSKESSEQRFYDLGKVIMLQNKRMGVHFQCDYDLLINENKSNLLENEAKAFRKGIRAANGIVGKIQNTHRTKRKRLITQFTPEEGTIQVQLSSGTENEIRQILGLKTLEFLDLSHLNEEPSAIQWNNIFKQSREMLLLSNYLPEAIYSLSKAIDSGILKEEELDKKVFKALMVKSLFL